MSHTRHRIQFPMDDGQALDQDEAYFYLVESGERRRIRFHDYDTIYSIPGLYEQLFYDRLKCMSPTKVAEILKSAVSQSQDHFTGLRVLDLGAGNGMMGEALFKYGVSRLVGADIIPEAYEALLRDRAGLYDDYFVADFCDLDDEQREELQSWSFNCLTVVAALGFGDIPSIAFVEAFNLVQPEGWIAFNIQETFLDNTDTSGFSTTIRQLILSDYMDLYHLERYRHRLSLEGVPLYYYAVAARKTADIGVDFMEKVGLAGRQTVAA